MPECLMERIERKFGNPFSPQVRWCGPWSAPGSGTQVHVNFLERPEKTHERAVQIRGTAARLAKVTRAELIGEGDRGRPQRAVLVSPLRPGNSVSLIHPDGEAHSSSMASRIEAWRFPTMECTMSRALLAACIASLLPLAAQQASTPHPLDPTPLEAVNRQLPSWLRFSGDERIRLEGVENGGFQPDGGDVYLLQRLRLNLKHQPASWLKVFVQTQDARVLWKKQTPAPPYQSTWDLRQAYAEIGDVRRSTGWPGTNWPRPRALALGPPMSFRARF